MASGSFTEGVRPGGLTTGKEIRILLCYLVDKAGGVLRRVDLEEVLAEAELANYFVLAESLGQLSQQGLLQEQDGLLQITEEGRTVARNLAEDLPRTVREAAVRGVISAQQYAARAAAYGCEILHEEKGRAVRCRIGDEAGQLFSLTLYMPDDLTAQAVKDRFVQQGEEVYQLLLAALTQNRPLALQALNSLVPAAPAGLEEGEPSGQPPK